MSENRIAEGVVEAVFRVHRWFGPGLLESAYEACLAHELVEMGFAVEKQVPLPLTYRDVKLDAGYRLDLWVNRAVIIEVKAIEELHPVHMAQMITLSGFSAAMAFAVLRHVPGAFQLVRYCTGMS